MTTDPQFDGVTVVYTKPPVYDRIVEAIGKPSDTTVYTYGEVIHSPSGKIPLDVLKHERVHVLQQRVLGRDEWWERYLADPEFRVSQEVPAYQAQYQYLRTIHKDRNELARELWQMARGLAGPLYGHAIHLNEATNAIKRQP